MPRDFRMCRPRLRSPLLSRSRSTSQVSTSEEIAASVRSSAPPPIFRSVSIAVIPFCFRQSTNRIRAALTSKDVPLVSKPGDWIDDHHFRREFGDELDHASEMHFQAEMKRPHVLKLEPPLLHPLLQV